LVSRRFLKINFGAETMLLWPDLATDPLRWIFTNLNHPPRVYEIRLRYAMLRRDFAASSSDSGPPTALVSRGENHDQFSLSQKIPGHPS
jgi:hypothetical protein